VGWPIAEAQVKAFETSMRRVMEAAWKLGQIKRGFGQVECILELQRRVDTNAKSISELLTGMNEMDQELISLAQRASTVVRRLNLAVESWPLRRGKAVLAS